MTSPIGKLLLQYTKLPLDVIQYCIESYFGVTEKEVRDNRKKLIMELDWLFAFFVDRHRDRIRSTPLRHIRIEREHLIARVRSHIIDRRMRACNEYMVTLPFPRGESMYIRRKSCFQRCLEWLNLSDGSSYFQAEGIKVNLKTKEVIISNIYTDFYQIYRI